MAQKLEAARKQYLIEPGWEPRGTETKNDGADPGREDGAIMRRSTVLVAPTASVEKLPIGGGEILRELLGRRDICTGRQHAHAVGPTGFRRRSSGEGLGARENLRAARIAFRAYPVKAAGCANNSEVHRCRDEHSRSNSACIPTSIRK